MSENHGANTITVHDKTFVLAQRGGGEAVHLVPEAQYTAGTPRPIGDESDYGGPFNLRYGRSELEDPRWAERTLCGRSEWRMAPTDVGEVYAAQDWLRSDPAFAPSCRRCLAILDGQFPHQKGMLAWTQWWRAASTRSPIGGLRRSTRPRLTRFPSLASGCEPPPKHEAGKSRRWFTGPVSLPHPRMPCRRSTNADRSVRSRRDRTPSGGRGRQPVHRAALLAILLDRR